jgi:hypothetical protein
MMKEFSFVKLFFHQFSCESSVEKLDLSAIIFFRGFSRRFYCLKEKKIKRRRILNEMFMTLKVSYTIVSSSSSSSLYVVHFSPPTDRHNNLRVVVKKRKKKKRQQKKISSDDIDSLLCFLNILIVIRLVDDDRNQQMKWLFSYVL